MVLSKRNTGKYLTREWNDQDGERQQCLYDQRNYSAADRTRYEVTGTGVFNGLGYQVDDACGQLEVAPIDPEDSPQGTYDHRSKPEVGF